MKAKKNEVIFEVKAKILRIEHNGYTPQGAVKKIVYLLDKNDNLYICHIKPSSNIAYAIENYRRVFCMCSFYITPNTGRSVLIDVEKCNEN